MSNLEETSFNKIFNIFSNIILKHSDILKWLINIIII